MERFFNTAGPNNLGDSYTLNPLTRLDLEDVLTLISHKRYFVLQALQLLLQCFLQRIVNVGSYIDREYGLSRGRTNLHMGRVGSVDEGHFIIFDAHSKKHGKSVSGTNLTPIKPILSLRGACNKIWASSHLFPA